MSFVSKSRVAIIAVALLLLSCLLSVAFAHEEQQQQQQQQQGESSQFNLLRDVRTFEVVNPKLLISKFEAQSEGAVPKRFADHAEYQFQAFGRTFHLTLEKNQELFGTNYVEIFYGESNTTNGGDNITQNQPSLDDINCHYWGRENRSMDSNVVVSTCDGLRGLITTQGISYFIEPAAEHLQHIQQQQLMQAGITTANEVASAHVFYRVQDMTPKEYSCGVEAEGAHAHTTQSLVKEFLSQTNFIPTSTSTSASSTTPSSSTAEQKGSFELADAVPSTLYVQLLFANDLSRYTKLGAATQARTSSYLNMINNFYANSGMSPTVRIVLVGQVTFTTSDPFSKQFIGSEVDVNNLLANFQNWHTNTVGLPAHDVGQLISSLDFYGPIIGYAPVGGMCQRGYSGGLIQDSYGDLVTAMVCAHEMGHNFGMQHDSVGNTCSPSGNIMANIGCTSCSASAVFSSCSKAAFNNWVATSPYKSCLYDLT